MAYTRSEAPLIYRPRIARVSKIDPSEVSPALEPVSLSDMKEHGYVEDDADDDQITQHISAARRWVEGYTNRAILTQTWTLKLSEFPSADYQLIELPGGTLQSVTSVAYLDSAGASQTWAAENYTVDTAAVPGTIGLAYAKSWPTVREWQLPITIQYVVGYGAAGDVPADLLQAIKHLAAFLFEHRGDDGGDLPRAVKLLASRHRVYPALRSGL